MTILTEAEMGKANVLLICVILVVGSFALAEEPRPPAAVACRNVDGTLTYIWPLFTQS